MTHERNDLFGGTVAVCDGCGTEPVDGRCGCVRRRRPAGNACQMSLGVDVPTVREVAAESGATVRLEQLVFGGGDAA